MQGQRDIGIDGEQPDRVSAHDQEKGETTAQARALPTTYARPRTVSIVYLILSAGKRFTGLEESRSPYSRSHQRRLKRRGKEKIVSDFGGLKSAISMIEHGTIEEPNISQEFEDSIGTSEQSARNLRPGQI